MDADTDAATATDIVTDTTTATNIAFANVFATATATSPATATATDDATATATDDATDTATDVNAGAAADVVVAVSVYADTEDDTDIVGSKRHSLQAVELSQRTQVAVQIVSNLPAPSNGGPIYRFWACRPCGPAGWLALLLTKAGDVETNPGPTTVNKKAWICDICHKQNNNTCQKADIHKVQQD